MSNGKLNKDTLVPIGLVAGVAVALATGAVWLNTKLQSIDFKMEMLSQQLKAVTVQLETDHREHWSTRDMELWAKLLRAQNPDIKIPEISR